MFIQLFSSCFFFFFVFFFVSCFYFFFFFFSSRRRHTRSLCDWSSDVCSSDLLWAAHLKPEMGGQGYGQVKLALLNELLGRSRWAPSVFGCQAPDSGNAEILEIGRASCRERVEDPEVADGAGITQEARSDGRRV